MPPSRMTPRAGLAGRSASRQTSSPAPSQRLAEQCGRLASAGECGDWNWEPRVRFDINASAFKRLLTAAAHRPRKPDRSGPSALPQKTLGARTTQRHIRDYTISGAGRKIKPLAAGAWVNHPTVGLPGCNDSATGKRARSRAATAPGAPGRDAGPGWSRDQDTGNCCRYWSPSPTPPNPSGCSPHPPHNSRARR